jgi:DNA-directed RNA polymerase subunit K/omega
MEREKLDELIERVGGREKLTSVIQRRLKELARGEPIKIGNAPSDLVEIALLEAFEGVIDLTAEPARPPVPEPYNAADRPSPMMRPPRVGFRPRGPEPRSIGRGPVRRGPPGGGGPRGFNRGGNRWQGPR